MTHEKARPSVRLDRATNPRGLGGRGSSRSQMSPNDKAGTPEGGDRFSSAALRSNCSTQ